MEGFRRRKTREVLMGPVGVGGDNPVRIQSMTTSNTRDVEATRDQILWLVDAGCEIVRVTVQGIKEAEACEAIKHELLKRGCRVPLVADIHFFPPAALRVVDFVDKVRINPGNFVDKRASFKVVEYDDETYAKELEKIEEKFAPLVQKCKVLKRAMRIGTNHGSLSDRIMNRYGDTPRGMVESALEFARVCRKYEYHDFLFSMKASNPKVMMEAYRQLVAKMDELGWDYPLHLGVTEAGEGEDGRIKSAMGIGSLLLEGIGDTIRVSLTEDPWKEVDPCRRLISFASSYEGKKIDRVPSFIEKGLPIQRSSSLLPSKEAMVGGLVRTFEEDLSALDFLIFQERVEDGALLEKLKDKILLSFHREQPGALPILSLAEWKDASLSQAAVQVKEESPAMWESLYEKPPALLLFSPSSCFLPRARQFFSWMKERGVNLPVFLAPHYDKDKEDLTIASAAECGSLLCEGLGSGLCLLSSLEPSLLVNLTLGILQAARRKISKTEFISCPGCGRTLFDLQEVSRRIRAKTGHLPGVKIAIMGCIVNGPGEMADADFGYVGSKPGKVDLYIGKDCVEKDVDFACADDRLIQLIKAEGRWIEGAQ